MRAAYATLAVVALVLSGCSGGTENQAATTSPASPPKAIATNIPLRLVVVAGRRVDVVDLDGGRAWSVDLGRQTINRGLVAVLPPTAAAPAGAVAVPTSAGPRVVPLDGGKARSVDRSGFAVLPRAGGGGWLANGIDVSALIAGADPVPVGQLPLTAEAVEIQQPASRLVISHDDATWLWEPATGREVRFSEPCTGPMLGASATTIVSVPCDGSAGLVVTDAATGSSRHVRFPPSVWIDAWDVNHLVSPDGGALAVTRFMRPRQVWYVDLATGHARKALDGTALGWSPDGRWLAVSTPVSERNALPTGTPHSELVRLWSPYGPVVDAARITVGNTVGGEVLSGALVP